MALSVATLKGSWVIISCHHLSDHQVFPILILSCALPHLLFLDMCSKWGIWAWHTASGWDGSSAVTPTPSPQQDGGDSSLCDGPVLQGCCMLIWPIVSGWLLSQCLQTKGLCADLCFALFNIYIWILAWLQCKDIKAAAKKGILLSAFDGRFWEGICVDVLKFAMLHRFSLAPTASLAWTQRWFIWLWLIVTCELKLIWYFKRCSFVPTLVKSTLVKDIILMINTS